MKNDRKQKVGKSAGRMVSLGFGIVFIIAGIYIFTISILNYQSQLNQRDWIVTDAEVTDVESYYRTSSGRDRRRYRVYSIDYQYEVDGVAYTGFIYETRRQKVRGEVFSVKYDPEAHGTSTHILKPDGGTIFSGLIGLMVFGCSGSWIALRSLNLPKKKRKRKKRTSRPQ